MIRLVACLVSMTVGFAPWAWGAEGGGALKATKGNGLAIKIALVQIVEPANPAQVARYSRVELLVSLSNVAAKKFYDPDPASSGLDLSATFTGPGGAVWKVNGFYDGSSWRVRFAPNAAGPWTFSVTARDSSGQANWKGGAFTCVASAYPGWARIDGRCLRFTEGRVLFGVGHNTGWQANVEQPALSEMAAGRENVLSFWIAMPWAQPSWASASEPYWDDRAPVENAEQGIGNYNQAACAYLDGVVARAEAANVCLLPSIWSHGQLRDTGHPWGDGWWYNNAYKTLCTASDFFKMTTGKANTAQWRYQKNFYRYLIARWGYSRAIAGWVGLVEMDGTSGYVRNPAQAESWCVAVRDYFAANDAFRRDAAGGYPIAFTKVDDAAWKSGFPLRATDSYQQQRSNVEVAAVIAAETQTMWQSGRPCFHAEFGGDTLNGASQPAHLHNGIWPGTAAGAALAPLVWCDGGNFPMLTPEMRSHLQYLAQFTDGIDYLGAAGLVKASLTVSGSGCRGWGMTASTKGFAWVQNTVSGGSMGGQTLRVSGLSVGAYRVEWFDGWSSGSTPMRVDEPVAVGSDGVLAVTIPALARADIGGRFAWTGPGARSAVVARGDVTVKRNVVPVAVAVNPVVVGSISGSITDSGTGSGLAGVAVMLEREDRGVWVPAAMTSTDAEGEYAFGDVSAGAYRVIPLGGGEGFEPVFAEAVIDGGGDREVRDFTAGPG